MSGSEA